MRKSLVWSFVLCLLFSAVFSIPAHAQVSTASLTGMVKDQSDALVPNAKVTAKNKATNAEHTAMTDTSGYYAFPTLPIGEYTVSVEAGGFKRSEQAITLEIAEHARQDFTMQVGAVETTVSVEANPVMLSTQDAMNGGVVDNRYVSQYPLLLRSWDDLMRLVAGVQGDRYTDQGGGTSFGRTGGFNVHGVRSLENNFVLDGIDNNSISENVQELTTQVVRPSVDAIQEFKIITDPYSAEYGRSPGAAILVITKGGTNQLHGTAYEYLRNRVFDANDFFSNRSGLAKPQRVQNQFGANLGGPIKKDKLFFFYDYEGTRIRQGALRITTVPLANERIGDFSAAAGAAVGLKYPTIYDPATSSNPTQWTPFTNNQIPSNRIDPVMKKLMALFPAPTNPLAETNNFVRNAGLMDDIDRHNWRLDWQPTSKDSVFARMSLSNRTKFTPGNFGGIADGTSSSAQGRYILTAYQVAIGWTRPITSRLVNEFRIGFARDNSFAQQDPFGLNKISDYIPGVPDLPAVAGGVSRTSFTNFGFVGSPDFLPKFQVADQWQWSDTVSITRGKHQIKVGGDLRAPLRNIFQDIPSTRGTLGFDKIFTCQRGANLQCASGGISYADGLLGYVQSAALTNLHQVDQRLHMLSFFGQDDYKMTRNLTINLGIRYDFATPALEGKNAIANFDPTGSGALVFGKSGSISNRALVNPDTNNFAPRVGFAYQLNPKTVIRSGYGIFYSLFERIGSEDQLSLNPPAVVQNSISLASTAAAPIFVLQNGFPANFLDPNGAGLLTRVKVRGANPNAPNTYVQQWSLGVQRMLPKNMSLDVSYVGTKSTHLNTLRNFNQPINGVLPYPNFNQIEYRDPLGNAIYHGLDATLERRFAGGLSFRAAYTWSKSIDNTAEHLTVYGSNSFDQNSRDFHSWRGPSDFDTPQRFIPSWIYDLPFGKGKKFVQNGPAAWIVGGFEISGSATFASGRPFTLFANSNNSAIDRGLQNALPNVIGPIVQPHNVDCWFFYSKASKCAALYPSLTDGISVPAPSNTAAGFGNAGRNNLRAPGTIGLDFSVHRVFRITESKDLEFRWETFNLTNTTAFGLPSMNVTSSAAATITSLANDPRIMQFALRFKF